jgi:hypothetical protein
MLPAMVPVLPRSLADRAADTRSLSAARVAAPVSPGDPLGIPTEAILAGERDSDARGKQNALTTSSSGEEALMSLSRAARRISLPALLAVVVAALLALAPGRATPAGASIGAAAAGGTHPAKPVIVLEHGAWADASSWNSVISQLQLRGFTVYAPPNPLRGLGRDRDGRPRHPVREPDFYG